MSTIPPVTRFRPYVRATTRDEHDPQYVVGQRSNPMTMIDRYLEVRIWLAQALQRRISAMLHLDHSDNLTRAYNDSAMAVHALTARRRPEVAEWLDNRGCHA